MLAETSQLEEMTCSHNQENYELTYQSSEDPWDYYSYADQTRFHKLAECGRRWCSHPERTLDVACGLGQLAREVAQFSKEVWAYDFAKSAVQRARQLCAQVKPGRMHIDVRDATNPGLPSNFFDLILISDIVTDGGYEWKKKILEHAIDSLKPNGFMLVSGRVKHSAREPFDRILLDLGGRVMERLYFHDKYWFKARSGLKRICSKGIERRLLASSIPFRIAETVGRVHGAKGSIHYGVVVQYSKQDAVRLAAA